MMVDGDDIQKFISFQRQCPQYAALFSSTTAFLHDEHTTSAKCGNLSYVSHTMMSYFY